MFYLSRSSRQQHGNLIMRRAASTFIVLDRHNKNKALHSFFVRYSTLFTKDIAISNISLTACLQLLKYTYPIQT
jgi:hypothetical protein